MKILEQNISPLIENQFPTFYKEEGQNFIAFIKAYYEWMEAENNVLNTSRNLMEYKDIDTTIDQFIDNFKAEYLHNFPIVTASSTDFIIKHIRDYYISKGSSEGIKLLFLLLFGQNAEIFNPNEHIMKASDGEWKLPEYVELNSGETAKNFIGKAVYGSISGASAFAEGFIRKRLVGRFIDVLFISHREGKFQQGELLTDSKGDLSDAPEIVGSLTKINIDNGGSNNKIGDLYSINGIYGKDGLARVSAVIDGTGRVVFTLVDGGSGYSNTANVLISNTTFLYSNMSNANTQITGFSDFEQIVQPIAVYPYNTLLGANSFTIGANVYAYTTGGLLKANGYIIESNPSNTTAGSLTVSVLSGNFGLSNNIQTTGNTVNAQSAGGITSTNVTATYLGSNSTAIGVINTSNTLHAHGAFFYGGISNTYANIVSIGTGSSATFKVGKLAATEIVTLVPDFLTEFNTGNVQFVTYPATGVPNSWPSITLGGWNSNVGGNQINSVVIYAGGTNYKNTDTIVFSGGAVGNVGNPSIPAVATLSTNSTGGIDTVTVTNNGANYFTLPGVTVTTSTGSGANLIANSYFALGFPQLGSANLNSEIVLCLQDVTKTIGTIASLSDQNQGSNYNLAPFVKVIEYPVAVFNRRDLILYISGSNNLFAPGQILYQTIAGNVARGLVKTANSSVITMKRLSFNTFFAADGVTTLTSQDSFGTTQGSAVINLIDQDMSTLPMGENAIVTANVETANGIVTDLQILFSGYGYVNNEPLTLTSNTNQFIISATANIQYQGIGLGYWKNDKGLLNSDMIIHDNDVYQEYSYVVQTGISIDKYADMLKQLFHVAGSKMSGEVIRESDQDIFLVSTPSEISLT